MCVHVPCVYWPPARFRWAGRYSRAAGVADVGAAVPFLHLECHLFEIRRSCVNVFAIFLSFLNFHFTITIYTWY